MNFATLSLQLMQKAFSCAYKQFILLNKKNGSQNFSNGMGGGWLDYINNNAHSGPTHRFLPQGRVWQKLECKRGSKCCTSALSKSNTKFIQMFSFAEGEPI